MTKAVDYDKLVAWLENAKELFKAMDARQLVDFVNLLLMKLDDFVIEEAKERE